MTDSPQRPECFEFALDFLGDPEAAELRVYVEQLEARAALAAEPVADGPTYDDLSELYSKHGLDVDGWPLEKFDALWKVARAVLARWGHQPAPPADVTPGPTHWLPATALPLPAGEVE